MPILGVMTKRKRNLTRVVQSSFPSVVTTEDNYKSGNMGLQNEFGYTEAFRSIKIARHIPPRRAMNQWAWRGGLERVECPKQPHLNLAPLPGDKSLQTERFAFSTYLLL